MFWRKVEALRPAPAGKPWLREAPRASDIHVVLVQRLDTGQQWRSLKTKRVFDVPFADALLGANIGDRAFLRYGAGEVAFVRDPDFDYGSGRGEGG